MNDLAIKPIKGILISLILPSLITVLVSGSYNLVDGIFIGQKLGIRGSSANSYTFMIYALVYSFSALVSQGVASLMSIHSGKQQQDKMIDTLRVGIIISLLIAFIQAILIWILLPLIIKLFGAPSVYYQYINTFTHCFLLGSPFYFIAHTLLYSIRAQGKIKMILIINGIAFLANLIMGFLLIIKFNLGFVGSASATIIANVVVCILTWRYYSSALNIKLTNWITCFFKRISMIIKILSMGLPFWLTSVISVVLLSLYNRIAFAYGGTYGLATLSIVSSIYRYIISLMNAITSGVQPVISYNYGAKLNQRVKEARSFSFKLGTLFSLLLFILIEFLSIPITNLFNSSSSYFIKYAAQALQIVMISLPLQGFINIGTSYFQYINQSKKSTMLVILRQVILQVPLALILPILLSINGLWLSYVIADVIIFIIIIIMVR